MKFLRILCLAALLLAQNLQASPADTLRILAVGNSFSDDATEWLPGLLEGAGIHNVIVARLYIGGCSLERHCHEYEGGNGSYRYSKSTENRWVVLSKEATLEQGLRDEPWDIVTIQQSSPLSGMWESYSPWTERLVGIIRSCCSNPAARIVWHQTWAYARSSTHRAFPNYGCNQMIMYNKILDCTDAVCKTYGFDTVIPNGIAVQNARWNHILFDGKDLTRDGYHLNKGYTRYLGACTWFETLIRPFAGKGVQGNPFRMQGTEYEIDASLARKFQRTAAATVRKNR